MKTRTRILRNALVGLAGYALAATAAHAITISGQEVGSLDGLCGGIASTSSGQAYEEAQLVIACGAGASGLTLVSNINTPGGAGVVTDGTNSYINVTPNEPGYFVLKFGTGNTGNDMFFFTNLASLNFLVWSNAQLTGAGLPSNHIQSISHYTYTTSSSSSSAGGEGSSSSSSSGNQVPEPASTLVLLGLGLMGVGFTRRLKKAA